MKLELSIPRLSKSEIENWLYISETDELSTKCAEVFENDEWARRKFIRVVDTRKILVNGFRKNNLGVAFWVDNHVPIWCVVAMGSGWALSCLPTAKSALNFCREIEHKGEWVADYGIEDDEMESLEIERIKALRQARLEIPTYVDGADALNEESDRIYLHIRWHLENG
jgi:hypothetical protein